MPFAKGHDRVSGFRGQDQEEQLMKKADPITMWAEYCRRELKNTNFARNVTKTLLYGHGVIRLYRQIH